MNRVKVETDFTETGTKIIDAETGAELRGLLNIGMSQIGDLRTYSITVKVWVGNKKDAEMSAL